MGDFSSRRQTLFGRKDAILQPDERDGSVIEAPKFFSFYVTLFFPESVEHADKRAALPKIVMQVKQLVARIGWCTQQRFDLFLITGNLEFTRSVDKRLVF